MSVRLDIMFPLTPGAWEGTAVVIVQAYRFALDPAPGQERALRSHAGAARFAWNWGLAACLERYRAERKWYSGAELHKRWNAQKKADPGLAWWEQNSKCAYQEAFRDLDRALREFTRSVRGERQGRRLRRAGRAHARTNPGSAGRRKAAARLARLHARIANLRADALHKATTMLAARYETIVVEDLNVAGMTRNRRLARAVSDQGFGAARRMLGYKTAWDGGTLVAAGRWYPSSKTCSGCGAVKAKLGLAERTYQCVECGLVLDRDVNAARNLLSLAASGAERRNAGGGTVRPRPARHDPPNPEPGTPHGDKTGTATATVAAA